MFSATRFSNMWRCDNSTLCSRSKIDLYLKWETFFNICRTLWSTNSFRTDRRTDYKQQNINIQINCSQITFTLWYIQFIRIDEHFFESRVGTYPAQTI